MNRTSITIFICSLMLLNSFTLAAASSTKRIPYFNNDRVSVWKTIIYPSKNQELKMHRHEHDRVLVAFTDGKLKITNNKGRTHYLKLVKNQAYYLTKDIPDELHTDENVTSHPIKVLVIELNDKTCAKWQRSDLRQAHV